MAFRKRTMRFRRTRRRWDMQTFRDCERELDALINPNEAGTCNAPQTFADYLCGIGPSTSPQMAAGASRAILFGGGHLRVRYNAAVLNDSNMPCGAAVKVITAIAKLPLLENSLTPAYLPNLAVARSQLSVVPATESDTDEDILFWRDEQLDLFNVTCLGFDDVDCTLTDCMQNVLGTATALWGRAQFEQHVKVKRRIREREALFLMTQYVARGFPPVQVNSPWPIFRNAYFRYAVR